MKRKKITLLIVLLFLLMPMAMAQEETEEEPKLVPGDFFYGIKKAFERIQLALTFDATEKAKIRLKIANERIRELKVLQKRNQTQYMLRLTEEHQSQIEAAEQDMERARIQGRNVSILAEHIANMTSKHIAVLLRVYQKVPEQAKPSILHAINASSQGYQKAIARVDNPGDYAPSEVIREMKKEREQQK